MPKRCSEGSNPSLSASAFAEPTKSAYPIVCSLIPQNNYLIVRPGDRSLQGGGDVSVRFHPISYDHAGAPYQDISCRRSQSVVSHRCSLGLGIDDSNQLLMQKPVRCDHALGSHGCPLAPAI